MLAGALTQLAFSRLLLPLGRLRMPFSCGRDMIGSSVLELVLWAARLSAIAGRANTERLAADAAEAVPGGRIFDDAPAAEGTP